MQNSIVNSLFNLLISRPIWSCKVNGDLLVGTPAEKPAPSFAASYQNMIEPIAGENKEEPTYKNFRKSGRNLIISA